MTIRSNLAAQIDPERVVACFLELAQIDAPSLHEAPMRDFLRGRLEAMGFQLDTDDAGAKIGGECDNLFAWWPGTDPTLPPLFFSTHLDTVLPTRGLKPIIRDGIIYSDGTTILGADDRSALAAYLEGIRIVQESGMRVGPIELVLTVAEQMALLGAKHLDYSKVRARCGYIFDSSGDVGQIILQGPYGKYVRWRIEGRPAHVGLEPEKGVNAILAAAAGLRQMTLGKISETTNANVGVIRAGTLASIVPAEAELIGEVRSYSEADMDAQVAHMLDAMHAGAEAAGGRAHAEIERKYQGWSFAEDSKHVQIAVRAAARAGVQPYFTRTLGGADTNIFNERGLTCLTLGNGFRDIHTFNEHISVENVANTARCVVTLIEEYTASHTGA